MRCAAVQKRIVAWQDAELSPGETVMLTEHLGSCADCRGVETRTRTATPRVDLVIPPAVRTRLLAATRTELLLAAAADPKRQRWPRRPLLVRWLDRVIEVPRWGLLTAAALLSLTIGYALHTSISLDAAQAELANRATTPPPWTDTDPTILPADQFRPASYQPTLDGTYR